MSTFYFVYRYLNVAKQAWYDIQVQSLKKLKTYVLTSLEHINLLGTYKFLYPNLDIDKVIVPVFCWKTKEVNLGGELFGSIASRSNRSAYVMAYWAGSNGTIEKYENLYISTARPGIVHYYIKHVIVIDEVPYEHWLAHCEWFLPYQENPYGQPIEVWRLNLFEQWLPRVFYSYAHSP